MQDYAKTAVRLQSVALTLRKDMATLRIDHAARISELSKQCAMLQTRIPPPLPYILGTSAAAKKRQRRRERSRIAALQASPSRDRMDIDGEEKHAPAPRAAAASAAASSSSAAARRRSQRH